MKGKTLKSVQRAERAALKSQGVDAAAIYETLLERVYLMGVRHGLERAGEASTTPPSKARKGKRNG